MKRMILTPTTMSTVFPYIEVMLKMTKYAMVMKITALRNAHDSEFVEAMNVRTKNATIVYCGDVLLKRVRDDDCV